MQILKSVNKYDVLDSVEIINELPVGNYELKIGAFGRIFLKKIDDISLPEKVYSNDSNFIEHVLNQWNKESLNLGIGLIGKKGLGKSFTSNVIAKKTNIPVIRITSNPERVDIFNYINKIKQDVVLFIDEFEKLFPNRSASISGTNLHESRTTQEAFLSFLDNGQVNEYKRLFIITANNESDINDFLKNRPSRLRYLKIYDKLEDTIIKEIVDDRLLNKDFIQDIIQNLPYNNINIDALIQIINEVNTHNMPYSSFKSFFNFKESNNGKTYTVTLADGTVISKDILYLNEDIRLGTLKTKKGDRVALFIEDAIEIKDDSWHEGTAFYWEDDDTRETIKILVKENTFQSKYHYLV